MANEVKLEVYTVRIRQSGDKSNFIKLNDFYNGKDFIVFFQEYISSFDHQLELHEGQKRTLKLDSTKLRLASNKRMISGIIESGDYGYESTIYNTTTSKEQYKRQVEDTEIKPFYFLLYLPKDDDKCFLILQRLGIYGINGIVKNHLSQFFRSKYENLILDLDAFVSRRLAQTFINEGKIKEFSLTRYNLPSDIADNLGFQGYEEEIMSIELRIKARKNKGLSLRDRVKKFINNDNAKIFSLKELEMIGFDGKHNSKVKIQLGRNTRTIDLSDTGQIRPYYDIEKDVTKDASGHPVFDSIDSIAKDLIDELEQELGK